MLHFLVQVGPYLGTFPATRTTHAKTRLGFQWFQSVPGPHLIVETRLICIRMIINRWCIQKDLCVITYLLLVSADTRSFVRSFYSLHSTIRSSIHHYFLSFCLSISSHHITCHFHSILSCIHYLLHSTFFPFIQILHKFINFPDSCHIWRCTALLLHCQRARTSSSLVLEGFADFETVKTYRLVNHWHDLNPEPATLSLSDRQQPKNLIDLKPWSKLWAKTWNPDPSLLALFLLSVRSKLREPQS